MKTVFINGSPKKKLSVSSYLLGAVRLLVRGEEALALGEVLCSMSCELCF